MNIEDLRVQFISGKTLTFIYEKVLAYEISKDLIDIVFKDGGHIIIPLRNVEVFEVNKKEDKE